MAPYGEIIGKHSNGDWLVKGEDKSAVVLEGSNSIRFSKGTRVFYASTSDRYGLLFAKNYWVPRPGEDPEAELRAKLQARRIENASSKMMELDARVSRVLQQIDLRGVKAIVYFDIVPTTDHKQHYIVVAKGLYEAIDSASDATDGDIASTAFDHFGRNGLVGVTAYCRGQEFSKLPPIHRKGETLFVAVDGLIDRQFEEWPRIKQETLEMCVEASRLN